MLPMVELVRVQCVPLAVRRAGSVGEHGMDMGLRLATPVHVVKEGGGDQIAGPLGGLNAANCDPALRDVPLHPD